MTTAILAINKAQKNIKNKISSVDMPQVNWKIICCLGIFMSFMLLIFYAYQINSLTRDSYLISGYQKQIGKLMEENKNLQASFTESSFLGEALVKIEALNFQKSTSIKYIQVPDNSIVVARK